MTGARARLSKRTKAKPRLLADIRKVHARSRENYGTVKTRRALLETGEICDQPGGKTAPIRGHLCQTPVVGFVLPMQSTSEPAALSRKR
jgi:hypothetical protein